jgi:hypothetical protein
MKDVVMNVFEELDGKKKINAAQKTMLREQYNLYSGGFAYVVDEWGGLIIECNDDTFKNIEYYLGFEYERENQEVLIKANQKVIVSYSGGERIEKLVSQLEALEEVSV